MYKNITSFVSKFRSCYISRFTVKFTFIDLTKSLTIWNDRSISITRNIGALTPCPQGRCVWLVVVRLLRKLDSSNNEKQGFFLMADQTNA
jgi:hypothetical protein